MSTDTTQTCPTVRYTFHGTRAPFVLHRVSTPAGPQFPTTVCELGVPFSASNAVLEASTIHATSWHPANHELPLPNWGANPRPRSVAVIGDTGCRVPTMGLVQDCANGWPFGQISKSAAATKPDLVVHVGDYLYREDPGKANDTNLNPGCTTAGDRAHWDCVVADFFRPAADLLAVSPVALTRGNHEACQNGQSGGTGSAWFRYLADNLLDNGSCTEFTYPPSLIRAGTLTLASVDSSSADPSDNGTTTSAETTEFRDEFTVVNQDAQQYPGNDYFVFTHKPLWMVKSVGTTPTAVTWVTHALDSGLAATTLGRLADNVRLVLSGHIHLYQMVDFLNSTRPPQVTVGASGALPLDIGPPDSMTPGKLVGDPTQTVNQSRTQQGILGYAVLLDNGGNWDLTFHDAAGMALPQICTLDASLTNKKFTCH
ncbi:metallophosphoesterase [Embleya sp. NBC_00888]|uniref:metallophosphoesterase family protein n=1 Tax=Embleya sp. NBC_00888 TaxID=2975960 RepID=UPI002F91760D